MHQLKYQELKGLIDQYRIQVSQFEKITKQKVMVNIGNSKQARIEQLSTKIDLTHIDTDRVNKEKLIASSEVAEYHPP